MRVGTKLLFGDRVPAQLLINVNILTLNHKKYIVLFCQEGKSP